MKIVICGAGQVGYNIAKYLSRDQHDIVVIDKMPDLVRRISETLDVQSITGYASLPSVLKSAGAATADMLIAVTAEDEVNIVACQMAHMLFNVKTKIARIREQAYLKPQGIDIFSDDHIPIDLVISPEVEVAAAIERQLDVPGALEVIHLAEGRVKLVGVHCTEDCPIIHTPLGQLATLFPDLNIMVVGIIRGKSMIIPGKMDLLLPDDDVYYLIDSKQMERSLVAFGKEADVSHNIIIGGGGRIGLSVGRQLRENRPELNLTFIERDRDVAEHIAEEIPGVLVLKGSVLDADLLKEANAKRSQTYLAITDSDETNILSSMLAKYHGAEKVLCLLNSSAYEGLASTLMIDSVVNPRNITVSSILGHIRQGRISSVHAIRENFGEIIEARLAPDSALAGKMIIDMHLPEGVRIGVLIRDGNVIIPHKETVVKSNDHAIIFARVDVIKEVEELI